jgi:DeoR/GlpR family transcriptional regulator of sugar metabolism
LADSLAANRAALPAVRLRHALRLLQATGAVRCHDLQQVFNVSEATARRDIDALVCRGGAARVHGGAVLQDEVTAAWSRVVDAMPVEPERSRR